MNVSRVAVVSLILIAGSCHASYAGGAQGKGIYYLGVLSRSAATKSSAEKSNAAVYIGNAKDKYVKFANDVARRVAPSGVKMIAGQVPYVGKVVSVYSMYEKVDEVADAVDSKDYLKAAELVSKEIGFTAAKAAGAGIGFTTGGPSGAVAGAFAGKAIAVTSHAVLSAAVENFVFGD